MKKYIICRHEEIFHKAHPMCCCCCSLLFLEIGSDSATLAAFEFSESSSQEWLPMWLLEEAGLRNGGKSSHGEYVPRNYFSGS